jgi:hypothetical protein
MIIRKMSLIFSIQSFYKRQVLKKSFVSILFDHENWKNFPYLSKTDAEIIIE